MKILVVGGAVRDMALGNSPKDYDYLVQGATLEEFKQAYPEARMVGKDFPVFLLDGDEYAMARTERKTGHLHTDFKTFFDESVSVHADLRRRDLTINAMAMCPESGEVVCSPKAISDLKNKILRHNSEAFREDPLRVLRVARFAARFSDFTVAPETIEMMRSMREEICLLPAERIFNELEEALCSEAPRRFFEVLHECDCLNGWFPEVAALIGVKTGPDSGSHLGEVDTFDHVMRVMERISPKSPSLRFAGLCHDLGKALSENPPSHHGHDKAGVELVMSLCERLKVPKPFQRDALFFCAEHMRMHRILEMRPGKAVALILKANRVSGGLGGFMACTMADGMSFKEAAIIKVIGYYVLAVRLPEEFHGRGRACAEILNQCRCKEWSGNKVFYCKKVVDTDCDSGRFKTR